MRQAGRYMAEYRALRERYTILELIKTPELACEVTMQPINAFDLDAAIIFADILPPLEGMGLSLEFVKGEGPLIHNPVRTAADVDALRVRAAGGDACASRWRPSSWPAASWTSRGVPLIGFSGAPFTLAGYAVEGGGSQQPRARQEPDDVRAGDVAPADGKAERGRGRLPAGAGAGRRAGAAALRQLGRPAQPRRLPGATCCPTAGRAIEIARAGGVPIIHFGTDTAGMLPI